MKHKINMVFEELSLRRFTIGSIIKKCIAQTLAAERISVPSAKQTLTRSGPLCFRAVMRMD